MGWRFKKPLLSLRKTLSESTETSQKILVFFQFLNSLNQRAFPVTVGAGSGFCVCNYYKICQPNTSISPG